MQGHHRLPGRLPLQPAESTLNPARRRDGVSGPAAEYVFDTKHDRYPVAAHLILRNPDGRILLMQRAGTDYGEGQFGLPAGHVDLGETPTHSIVRETYEELGIIITPASLTPAGVMFRRSSSRASTSSSPPTRGAELRGSASRTNAPNSHGATRTISQPAPWSTSARSSTTSPPGGTSASTAGNPQSGYRYAVAAVSRDRARDLRSRVPLAGILRACRDLAKDTQVL